MSNVEKRLQALARHDLYAFARLAFRHLHPGTPFIDAPYLHFFAYTLMLVELGLERRLIINVAPRSLKSFFFSVVFPAWVLGRDATMRILTASYSDTIARNFSVATKVLMQTDWYQETFPETRFASKRPRDRELRTTKFGMRYASGTSGSITGLGGNLLICDDPCKPEDALTESGRRATIEFFRNTFSTRLDNKREGRNRHRDATAA